MAWYGRSDVASVAVAANSGGCGAIHSRPVTDGVPADLWDLEADCPRCAGALRGLKDPLWAAMPADIPETPDEKAIREDAEKRGEHAAKKSQAEINVKLTDTMALIAQQRTAAEPDPVLVAQLVQQELAKLVASGQFTIRGSENGWIPPHSDPADQAQQGPIPFSELSVTEEKSLLPDLEQLTIVQLRDIARERRIPLGAGIRAKADIIAVLRAELTAA